MLLNVIAFKVHPCLPITCRSVVKDVCVSAEYGWTNKTTQEVLRGWTVLSKSPTKLNFLHWTHLTLSLCMSKFASQEPGQPFPSWGLYGLFQKWLNPRSNRQYKLWLSYLDHWPAGFIGLWGWEPNWEECSCLSCGLIMILGLIRQMFKALWPFARTEVWCKFCVAEFHH